MDMLEALIQNDSPKLEKLLLENIDHINDPIGLPFETPTSRFFNHPVMSQMVILQHPDQTLFDIACGMPCGPSVWVLLAHGAKGSRHPLGTDLALHNAVKNGRSYTTQALLLPGRSNVNGIGGTTWKPLLQAVYWNHPDVVQILLSKGADIDSAGPCPQGTGYFTALQLCLHRRSSDYSDIAVRDRCNKILKMLLEAGANIHVAPPVGMTSSPFEMFLEPLQKTSFWALSMSSEEATCLSLFIHKGADPQSQFNQYPCGSVPRTTFAHQVLWHSTPTIARMVIDSVSSAPHSTGFSLLFELLGSCPDAKRHPSDTLRDIEVLIQSGVDCNLSDLNGITPLRKCIEHCPAVDLVARLQILLDNGADAEALGPDGDQPYVLAARTFSDTLLTEVMEQLVSKIQGRHRRLVGDVSHTWDSSQFPIAQDQSYQQVMSAARSTGDFRLKMREMVPEDVHVPFNHAYFSIVSKNYLDTMTRAVKIRTLKTNEKDEIIWILGMRSGINVTPYKFDQELVVALLDPPGLMDLDVPTQTSGSTIPAQTTPSSMTLSNTTPPPRHAPFQFNPNGSTTSAPPVSTEPSTQTDDADFFIPDTSQIRWKDPCAKVKPGDLAKAIEYTLQHKCNFCDDGTLLTKVELERHHVEHEHTATCIDEECARRFCVKARGRGRER